MTGVFRRRAVLGVISSALMLTDGRPAAQTSGPPTFRSATTLVEFTVVVQDRDGNPITDLRQEEITILEGKRQRDVAFFRFEGAREPDRSPVVLPKGMFSNRPEYRSAIPRNITAIVIDALNTAPQDQLTVRSQILRYLSTITPDTRVALYRAGEQIEVLHDFTSDVRSLRTRFANDAVEAPQHTGVGVTVEIPDVPEWRRQSLEPENVDVLELANRDRARLQEGSNQQIQSRRSTTTLHSLEVLGNHLAAIPGRKSIVWITPGTPTMSMGASDRWITNYDTAIRNLARRMATQGITIYPVEAYGIRPAEMKVNAQAQGASRGTPGTRQAAARAAIEASSEGTNPSDERQLPASMEILASITGGRIIRNTNDLTAGMKVAASDLRGAYSVGFYVAQNPDNEWHAFKVGVARPGVRIISRQGYLGLANHQPVEWTPDDWRAAANNPLGSTAVRLDARCTLLTDLVTITMQIPAEDLQFRPMNGVPSAQLDVALAEKTPQGLLGVRHEMMTFQVQDSQLTGLAQLRVRFTKDWPLKRSASMLRLLVRDRFTDRYGTIDLGLTDLIR